MHFAAPAGFEPAVIGVKVRYVVQLHQRAINSVLWHVSIPYFGTLLSRQESNLHSSDSESAMLAITPRDNITQFSDKSNYHAFVANYCLIYVNIFKE